MRIEANSSVGNVSSPYTDAAASGGIQTEIPPVQERGGDESLAKKPNKSNLQREIDSLNKWLQSHGTHIKFTLHEELNEYYVQVVNDETNEVIREIPPKKILDISAKLQEMIGLLVDEKR
ncbi:flagellar protein FlaG [Brevibacillus marinus]|uniref:flagellar protein FlaG n=1 Tax=Brevibacillus marinus TaxID=2496837 RepID=UPI000F82895E|nr:flagellar protein FlaG [Brevibacillus marinus]